MTQQFQTVLAKYQTKVDTLPEHRQLITTYEESMVKLLTFLEQYCDRTQNNHDLLHMCMRMSRGLMNPVIVIDAITQWKETT